MCHHTRRVLFRPAPAERGICQVCWLEMRSANPTSGDWHVHVVLTAEDLPLDAH